MCMFPGGWGRYAVPLCFMEMREEILLHLSMLHKGEAKPPSFVRGERGGMLLQRIFFRRGGAKRGILYLGSFLLV